MSSRTNVRDLTNQILELTTMAITINKSAAIPEHGGDNKMELDSGLEDKIALGIDLVDPIQVSDPVSLFVEGNGTGQT